MKVEINDFTGKTFIEIIKSDVEIIFKTDKGFEYVMSHDQDCCEYVSVDDVCGDLDDLLNTPILTASEEKFDRVNPEGLSKDYQDSFTWTFYKIATIKGYVTIRWYGESNGYYSESVDIHKKFYQ